MPGIEAGEPSLFERQMLKVSGQAKQVVSLLLVYDRMRTRQRKQPVQI